MEIMHEFHVSVNKISIIEFITKLAVAFTLLLAGFANVINLSKGGKIQN